MRKFLSKAKKPLLTLGLVVIGIISIAGNVSLVINKEAIEREVDGYFKHKISIGSIFYIFPNYIVLNNLTISNPDIPIKKASFILPRTLLRFSSFDMFLNGFLNVSQVTLYPSDIHYYALKGFLKNNFQEILEIIRNSPGNNIAIRVKETLLDFDRPGQPSYVATELRLRIRDDVMEGTGYFRTDQYHFSEDKNALPERKTKGWPLWYKLQSHLKPDGLEADYLILKSGNLHSKLWGSLRGGVFKVNGFAFLDTAKKHFSEEEYSTSRYFWRFPEEAELSNIDTYFLDLEGLVKLNFPDVRVENFRFTWNNIPVHFQGEVSLNEPVSLKADLLFHGAKTSSGIKSFFKEAGGNLSGTFDGQVFRGDGGGFIDFADRQGAGLSLEKALVDFQGMSFSFGQDKRPSTHWADIDVMYWVNKNEHKISVHDLQATGNIKVEGLKLIEIGAPFYDGQLKAKLWIDTVQKPSKITSHMELTDVDTAALEKLMIYFARFNGRMASSMDFTNVPEMSLSGDVTVFDGTLTDFAFFNWLGDSFRLPELKAIDFSQMSAQFLVDKKHIQLDDIRLMSKDVRIDGNFKVDSENLISSRLVLSLSRDLLDKSSKFRPVLAIFEKEKSFLGFYFQLSGNMNAMNFQWLPSEDKSRIQARIPDFIERLIERDVDTMMKP